MTAEPVVAAVVAELTAETFDEEVASSPVPVVVDVWAPWCGPCKTLAPIVEAVAREHALELRFFKLNADDHPSVATRLNVMSFPTLLVFQDGTVVKRLIGARGKRHLLEELADLLSR